MKQLCQQISFELLNTIESVHPPTDNHSHSTDTTGLDAHIWRIDWKQVFATQYQSCIVNYYETSAKTGQGVGAVFEGLLRDFLRTIQRKDCTVTPRYLEADAHK